MRRNHPGTRFAQHHPERVERTTVQWFVITERKQKCVEVLEVESRNLFERWGSHCQQRFFGGQRIKIYVGPQRDRRHRVRNEAWILQYNSPSMLNDHVFSSGGALGGISRTIAGIRPTWVVRSHSMNRAVRIGFLHGVVPVNTSSRLRRRTWRLFRFLLVFGELLLFYTRA